MAKLIFSIRSAIVLFDFSKLIWPDGEDSVSYWFQDGTFNVKVSYSQNSQAILLIFRNTSYQYFSLFPGARPWEFIGSEKEWPVYTGFGKVVEHFGTQLLEESEKASEQLGNKANRRHFQMYLETANLRIDVIAKEFDFEFMS